MKTSAAIQPTPAVLCKSCPWRKAAPKADEPGGSVPVCGVAKMRTVAAELSENGQKIMQCHDSTDDDPRPCAGFLSVVGYDSPGVRLAERWGILRKEDIGRPIRGLYGSVREMLLKADYIDVGDLGTHSRRRQRSSR